MGDPGPKFCEYFLNIIAPLKKTLQVSHRFYKCYFITDLFASWHIPKSFWWFFTEIRKEYLEILLLISLKQTINYSSLLYYSIIFALYSSFFLMPVHLAWSLYLKIIKIYNWDASGVWFGGCALPALHAMERVDSPWALLP